MAANKKNFTLFNLELCNSEEAYTIEDALYALLYSLDEKPKNVSFDIVVRFEEQETGE